MSTNKRKIYTLVHSTYFEKIKPLRIYPFRIVRWECWNPTKKYGNLIHHLAASALEKYEEIYEVSILEVKWELWPYFINDLLRAWSKEEDCVRKSAKIFDKYFEVDTTRQTITNLPVHSSNVELQ